MRRLVAPNRVARQRAENSGSLRLGSLRRSSQGKRDANTIPPTAPKRPNPPEASAEVVCTVIVLTAEVLPGDIEVGKNVMVAPARLEAVSATGPLTVPFRAVAVMVKTALFPPVTVNAAGVAVRLKSAEGGVAPVPVRVAVWGEPVAESATLTEAVSEPAAVGVKLMVRVQVAATASDEPQLLVCPKEDALVPEMVMPLNARGTLPVLLKVNGWVEAELPIVVEGKVSAVGLSVADWTMGAVPVPESAAVWGEPAALSATLRVAAKVVADAGVKFTEMLQLDPAASDEPHALVSAKSVGFDPVMLTPVMLRAAVPVLESPTTCELLVVFTVWFPKATLGGDRTATGVPLMPVPERVTV